MISNLRIKNNLKVNKMSECRFLGANALKKVKFLNEDLEISKLTVAQVMNIQKLSRDVKDDDENTSIKLLIEVLKSGVPEFKEYDDDVFHQLPMDELSKLSSEIMKFSGLDKK